MKVMKIDPVEVGREEAFELSNYELPTAKVERLIIRGVGHPDGDQVVFKQGRKYYIASLKVV